MADGELRRPDLAYDRGDCRGEPAGIVPPAEVGDDLAGHDAVAPRVGQGVFESVADSDPRFADGGDNEQDDAVVVLPAPDAPVPAELRRERLDVAPVERPPGNDDHLVAGRFLPCRELLRQPDSIGG